MNQLSKLIGATAVLIIFSCSPKKEKALEIDGSVIDSKTESILLLRPGQDMRFDSLIEIPVENGKFHYETKLQNPEGVNLLLGEAKDNGAGRYMPLFLENEHIKLTIYPEEQFDDNVVEGGVLNAEYKEYEKKLKSKFDEKLNPIRDSIHSLIETDQFHSDKMKVILSKLKNAPSHDEKVILYQKMDFLTEQNLDKTETAQLLSDKNDAIYHKMKVYEQNYIEENPTIVSYSFLLNNLIYDKESIDLELAKSDYKKLARAHPNHPYNNLALGLLNGIDNSKIGKKYVNFSAPDMHGNTVELSDKIDGQIALLDLWATWCGPCIAKSRTMLPIYNEYKDQGFTIVGVAGEFHNTDRLVKFLKKEEWPWLNLVELDRQNSIWQKYGVDGGGGGVFLIDGKGKIIAKNPTAAEVREELETRLN